MEGAFIPNGFKLCSESLPDTDAAFDSAQGTRLDIRFLDTRIIRVRHGRINPKIPDLAAIYANDLNEAAHSVGPRERFAFPAPKTVEESGGYTLASSEVEVHVQLSQDGEINLSWTHSSGSEPFLRDLPYRSYPLARRSRSASHFVFRNQWDRCYGMGERASPLLLNGRRFRLEGRDSLGYDAEATDPLYKSVPFQLVVDARNGSAFGIYYHTFGTGVADLGCEIDALFGPFRYVESHTGFLEYYIFAGPTPADCLTQFAKVVGFPALPPKYALGYLASAMGYAESEDAQDLIAKFPALCRQHDIPCDLLHLSSGYTVDPKTGARNVFTWNRSRFPEPEQLFSNLRKEGIRVAANIKPWLLTGHPDYDAVARAKGFVWDPVTDSPSLTRLWSAGEGATASGSYFDLLSKGGSDYWHRGVVSLLEKGIEGIWIDNNEYTVHDDLHVFNPPTGPAEAGRVGRGLQTLNMALISRNAMMATRPTKRPFLITRAAFPLMHGICSQSWSGDNLTSWKTMRGSIAIGLNAGLSLWSNYGHDTGGFVGPVPDPEMLARWVQLSCLQPRFCLHSWKVREGVVTEPWMHPSVLPIIRSAIHFRYKMIPYLYGLLHVAHETGHPVLRPLLFHYPSDPQAQTEHSSFLVGRDLLHAPILEEGATSRKVYLPEESGGWWDFWTGKWLLHSGWIDAAVPLEQHGALFARAGSMIATLTMVPRFIGDPKGENGERRILCFPLPATRDDLCETRLIEDDGELLDPEGVERHVIRLWMRNRGASEVEVGVEIERRARTWPLPVSQIWFVLPKGDSRSLVCAASTLSRELENGRTEIAVCLQ